ncbi:PTS sugar transporter subunit IIB, partial [Holdemania massiliensis]
MKRIIVACGSGIATSTIISSHLSELLDAHHIRYELIQCSLQEIESYVNEVHQIVTSKELQKRYPLPTLTA